MKDFILPDIGEGIVECELIKWLVKEGDLIVEDQAVAEVMTDKATVEIPAMYDGIVAKLYYQEGDIAKVHSPLFAMQTDASIGTSFEQTEKQAHKTNLGDQMSKNNEAVSSQKNNEQIIEAFVLPDIGEGIVECEIVQWHVSEGDFVTEDQVVVEVMTDKAVVEIPAKYEGQIVKLHYLKGEIAKVHTPLFDQLIGSQLGTIETKTTENNSVSSFADEENVVEHNNNHVVSDNKQGENFEAPVAVNRALASPAVRRIAREHGVGLETIQATGKKGRVLKQDVIKAMNTGATNQAKSQLQSAQSLGNTALNSASIKHAAPTIYEAPQDRVEAIKGIRAAMAKQMVASVSTIPHFTVSDELCMDKLINLRSQLKPDFEKIGLKLSFMPFFIKALSLALLEFPIINSRLNPEATELRYLSAHNIGLAVDAKIGLLVPNIKNVQNLSLLDIAKELNRLIDAARDGKLANTDLQGGSISISNVGAIGGITATPVINKPEVAIVALGKTQKLPRFDDQGNVQATNILMVNWSGDHRVIDGATMVKFNNLWLDYLGHPEKMLVHLR